MARKELYSRDYCESKVNAAKTAGISFLKYCRRVFNGLDDKALLSRYVSIVAACKRHSIATIGWNWSVATKAKKGVKKVSTPSKPKKSAPKSKKAPKQTEHVCSESTTCTEPEQENKD